MLLKPISLAVLGLTALGATAALGQTMTHGEDWSLSVNSTFFTDNTRGMLRSDDLITSGWKTLAEADQERVRTVCSALDLDIPMGGTTATDADGTTNSTDGVTDNAGAADTTAGTTADAGTTSSSDTSAGATSSTTSTDTTTTGNAGTDVIATPISDDTLQHLCRVLQQVKVDE